MSIQTQKQRIGSLGESIASKFLVKHGYKIIERNYRKKCGEIDIICKKDNLIHFIEVKTVSRETSSGEMAENYRPEDNIHEEKLKRIGRTIETYLIERETGLDWQFHAVLVFLYEKEKIAKIRLLADIII